MHIENYDHSAHEDPALIYAAIKLIENLAQQGKISQQVCQSILNDYRGTFVLSQSECYPNCIIKNENSVKVV